MSSSTKRNTAVKDRAEQVSAQNSKETFSDLGIFLNNQGITTNQGNPYKVGSTGRGVAKVVRTAWDYYSDQGDAISAQTIAEAFTKANGDYAYNDY